MVAFVNITEAVASVCAALGDIELDDSPDARGFQVRRHCARLWGEHEGIAALAHGVPYVSGKSYSHHAFRQRFYEYPSQLDELCHDAVDLSGTQDIWLCPMLRRDRARKKSNGLGGQHGWADVDGPWTPERARVLSESATPGTALVDSGTGHHVYLKVENWSSVESIVRLNLALRGALDGDAKHQNESLLRPPGTLNHKPRVFGYGEPRLVEIVEVWP